MYICINIALATKAEFDAALSDFNARLTTFEAGINSKIDSQVSSYLDRNGIWQGKDQIIVNNWVDGFQHAYYYGENGLVRDTTIKPTSRIMIALPDAENPLPTYKNYQVTITTDENGIAIMPENLVASDSRYVHHVYQAHMNGGNGWYASTLEGSWDKQPYFISNKSGLAFVEFDDYMAVNLMKPDPADWIVPGLTQLYVWNTYSSPITHPGAVSSLAVRYENWIREVNGSGLPSSVGEDVTYRDTNISSQIDNLTVLSDWNPWQATNNRYKGLDNYILTLGTTSWKHRYANIFVQKGHTYIFDQRACTVDSSGRLYLSTDSGDLEAFWLEAKPAKAVVY